MISGHHFLVNAIRLRPKLGVRSFSRHASSRREVCYEAATEGSQKKRSERESGSEMGHPRANSGYIGELRTVGMMLDDHLGCRSTHSALVPRTLSPTPAAFSTTSKPEHRLLALKRASLT